MLPVATHLQIPYNGSVLIWLHFQRFKARAYCILWVNLLSFNNFSSFKDRCYEELDQCFSKNGKFIVDQCPYFNAVLHENFRFRPVTDSLPHLCIQDTNIDGTFVKKGSIVMASLLAVMHNPNDFPEPESFNPERFYLNDQFQAYLIKTHRTDIIWAIWYKYKKS